jgi:hypothetical protein
MRRKRQIVLLAIVVIALVGVLIGLILKYGGTSVNVALPNPNGYDDLLNAYAQVKGNPGAYYPGPASDELRDLIATNVESLRLLRLGLSRTCSVPTAVAMNDISVVLTNLACFKVLAHLLAEEGRVAEQENRIGDAARSYVDCIHMGNEISRGGFIINHMVGIACGAIGANPLAKLVPALSCEQARPVIDELEKIDASSVTWEEVKRNENALIGHEFRKTANPIRWLIGWWQSRPARGRSERRHNIMLAHTRLLHVELALRCYQAEQGRPQQDLQELVPKYLHRVPLDPFSLTQQSVSYRPKGTNWLLYSIGMDRVDDGGQPVGKGPESKGDIFFDSPW